MGDMTAAPESAGGKATTLDVSGGRAIRLYHRYFLQLLSHTTYRLVLIWERGGPI